MGMPSSLSYSHPAQERLYNSPFSLPGNSSSRTHPPHLIKGALFSLYFLLTSISLVLGVCLSNSSASVATVIKPTAFLLRSGSSISTLIVRNPTLPTLRKSFDRSSAVAVQSALYSSCYKSLCTRSLLQPTYRRVTSLKMSSSTSALPQEHRRRVVVVGSANHDLTAYTSNVPRMGETVLGSSFETNCGGKGANQAVAAAGLHISPVSMICRVGRDSFGSALLANFRRVGVQYDETLTIVPPTDDSSSKAPTIHTGVAPIVVDTRTGDNMIIVIPGANHALGPEDVRSGINSLVESGDSPAIVLVQLEVLPETALEAMKMGREVGALTVLNPAPAPEGGALDEEFFKCVDVVIPNESELRSLCHISHTEEESEETMARKLLAKGVRQAVIVTLGARGAMIVSRKNENPDDVNVKYVKAPSSLPCNDQPVVDTVGAGDAFCGALCAYLSAGLDMSDAAMKACGIASMSVRKRGAQSSYPSADELPDVLKVDQRTIQQHEEQSTETLETPVKPVITFVTGNKKKLEEVRRILSRGEDDLPFAIDSKKIDLPELQGDPHDIAKEKCKLAAEQVHGPVLTEDTSLCFNALNGMPGPYIKWFLDKCGHDGLNDMLVGFEDTTAYAQTVVAFASGPDEEVHVFDGRTDGKIVRPRGSLEFGWDPIFEPHEGGGKTYAEMGKDEKNAISHRGRSFAKLREFLLSNAGAIKSAIK